MATVMNVKRLNDPYIGSLEWGGYVWTDDHVFRDPVFIRYYLSNDTTPWSPIETSAIANAMRSWANVANFTITKTDDPVQADLIEHLVPTLPDAWGQHETPQDGYDRGDFYTHGYYAYTSPGWDYFNPNGGLNIGGLGYYTMVHEIGHGLGLAHPFDDGGGSTVFPGVTDEWSTGSNGLDQGIWTVMSYAATQDPTTAHINYEGDAYWYDTAGNAVMTYGYNAGPMAFDIAAIQDLYGANTHYHTGNDTYYLPDTNAVGTYWTCIWDAGGTDSIAYTGARNTNINLKVATLDNSPSGGGYISWANDIHGGFTIAHGVVIENATGGSGNDHIVGNAFNNILDGNGGDDVLEGGGGNDILDGDGGYNAAVFSSTHTNYNLTRNLDGGIVAVGVGAGAVDGTDTLYDIESLRFSDGFYSIYYLGLDDFAGETKTKTGFIPVNGSAAGKVGYSGDHDWFSVNLTAGTAYKIDLGGVASSAGTLWDPHLRLYDASSKMVAADDDAGAGLDSRLFYTPTTTGTYYVDAFASSSMTGTYRASVQVNQTPQDVSGDGRSDILWRNDNGAVVNWDINDHTLLGGHTIGQVGNDWYNAGVADFNGDGRSDILWRNNDGTVVNWDMNDHTILGGYTIGQVGNAWDVAGVADFNGDGKSDILWRHDDGTVVLWDMNDHTLLGGYTVAQLGNDWHIAGLADFNGDSRSDILWRNNDGTVVLWDMNNHSMIGGYNLGKIGNDWHISGLADFNDDGKSDILWRHDNGTVVLWDMNDHTLLAGYTIGQIGNDWHIANVGDYNGDSKSDILWRNNDGTVVSWDMNDHTIASTFNFGVVGNDWHVIA